MGSVLLRRRRQSGDLLQPKVKAYMIIREMTEDEYPLLEEFLYNAIFIPEGVPKPPRDIIQNADLQVYIKDFGKRKGDCCLAAECDNKII